MSTEVNDRFYTGRTVLTEAQAETLENLLGYYDCHGALPHWTDDAVAFLRDLLPEGSAYKEAS